MRQLYDVVTELWDNFIAKPQMHGATSRLSHGGVRLLYDLATEVWDNYDFLLLIATEVRDNFMMFINFKTCTSHTQNHSEY